MNRALLLPSLVATIALIIVGWLYFKPDAEKAGQVAVATEAKELKNVPDVEVPIKKVTVYQGGAKTKKKLDLPQPVVDNEKQSVLASSKVPAGDRPHTVTTVIDTDTGKSETYVRTDPLPWLALESRGEFGVYYGMKNGQRTTRLQMRQDFIQFKSLHVGATGSIDVGGARPDAFIGVGVSYRW